MKTKKRFLGILFSLVMLLGMLPGMSLTAYAATNYDDYIPSQWDEAEQVAGKMVNFNGHKWYVISHEGETITLLAADTSFGIARFTDGTENDYSQSKIRETLDGMTAKGGSFADVADAIEEISFSDTSGTAKLYLLNADEVSGLPINVVKMNFTGGDASDGQWWLRSPDPDVNGNSMCAYVKEAEDEYGITEERVIKESKFVEHYFGVRPALKLNLSKVTFDSTTKTFSVSSSTVNVESVTLAPSAAQTIDVDGTVSFTATVSPDNATDKTVMWSVSGDAVKLYTDADCTTEVGTDAAETLTVYAKGISAGSATVTATSNADSTKTASCDVTVNEAGSGGGSSDYTLTIPSTLNVANSGWNATDGISATGTLESGKKLTVTASSANSWALKSGDNSVGYKLATASTDTEATTSWEFTELSNTAATKPMGIIVDDYSSKPAGTYTDTVTFTAAIEEESCVTEGTLITLADGTQAPIETIKVGDLVQTWSFWNGRYEAQPVTAVINHGVDEYTVHSLVFSDGTVVETINEHGFYSPDLNDYAFISPENVDEYIGRHFVLQSKDGGNEIVTLAESKTEIRRVGSYSLLTAYNYNFMAENMLTITMEYRPGCFHFFDIGDDMAYDSKKMAQDIERYGLYTADEFSEYVTPEQFDMLNGPYYKVLVGRGTLNDSDITKMIEAYLPEKSE